MLKNKYWLMPLLLILGAAFARLIPHAPNFTPLLSLALFSGASFDHKHLAFLAPLIAMIISDALLGFHALVPVIYLSMAFIVILGFYIRQRSILSVGLMSTLSAVIFFVISNLGVWACADYYTKDLPGLSACFIAALPFFVNTLMSSYLYSSIMFGILELYKQRSRLAVL